MGTTATPSGSLRGCWGSPLWCTLQPTRSNGASRPDEDDIVIYNRPNGNIIISTSQIKTTLSYTAGQIKTTLSYTTGQMEILSYLQAR